MARAPARAGVAAGGSGGRASGRRFAYFRGVWDELRKVVWPTRTELWRMTGVVVVTVILFSLLIGGADYGLGLLVQPILSNSSTTTPSTAAPATVPTATPSASPASSASASASPGASPSASASS